jgi:hypothetical protein
MSEEDDPPELLRREEDRPHLGDRPGVLRPPGQDGARVLAGLGVTRVTVALAQVFYSHRNLV